MLELIHIQQAPTLAWAVRGACHSLSLHISALGLCLSRLVRSSRIHSDLGMNRIHWMLLAASFPRGGFRFVTAWSSLYVSYSFLLLLMLISLFAYL
jgi:hypothetical protein